MTDHAKQFWSFMGALFATLVLGLAPIVVSGLMGKALPDALIATSDKAVTGLVALLGTISALLFRQSQTDQATAEAQRAQAETGRILADKQPPATTTPPSEPLDAPPADAGASNSTREA